MRKLPLILALAAAACNRAEGPSFDGSEGKGAPVIEHGERLSHVLGCAGCHGAAFTGAPIARGQPLDGPLYASNLTLAVPRLSDSQLRSIIRDGIHPVRHNLWSMPSQAFQFLSEPDYQALVAYLRTLRPTGAVQPTPQPDGVDRERMLSGLIKPAGDLVPIFRKAAPIDLGTDQSLGRYIASVTCASCHGPGLAGNPVTRAPNLDVVGAYGQRDFERLLTTGTGIGGRQLDPMMAYAARGRFVHLTIHERAALFAYLKDRATADQ